MKDTQTTIKTAMNFDMTDVMKRYAEETRLPSKVLSEHEQEIKRFLALCVVNPGKIGMRGPLDELWHTFIIFTSSYAKFCRALGGGFIHHLPESPTKEAAPRKKGITSYERFLIEYEKAFNEPPPVHLWPRPSNGGILDPSCNKCGIFCSETCAAINLGPNEDRY